MLRKSLVIFLFTVIAACSCVMAAVKTESADYVFTNGRVYTMNGRQPWAESVAVKGNRIVFVGSNVDAEKFIGPGTAMYNLNGKMLMPGFVDGHNHIICGAAGKRGVNLAGSKNREEMLKRISDYVKAHPEKPAYMGYNWNFMMFGDKPGTRHELDVICTEKPILIFSDDNHHAWFNTESMIKAGISKNTPDPVPGSEYLLREPDGTPSGVGIEYASWSNMAVAAGILGGGEMLEKVMKEIIPALPRHGITSCHDMGVFAPSLEQGYTGFDILQRWEREGKLHCRVVGVYGIRDASQDPSTHVEALRKWHEKYNSDLVQVNSLKIWADGTFLSHTGVQLEPYKDKPETKGESGWTTDVLEKWITMAQREGFDTHIHVEGDGSVRRSLDAIERVIKNEGPKGRRNALHHIDVIHPDDMGRFKSLGVGGNATPVWFVNYRGQYEEAIKIFGQKKVDEEYSMQKRLIDMGVNVSFGSDIPGTDPYEIAPLYEIQAAVTGVVPGDTTTLIPPKDRLPSLEQMLHGYTMAGAYQMHMEDRIGSIEEGKFADLIVLDHDLFKIQPEELSKTKVLLTMLNGKIVWRDEKY